MACPEPAEAAGVAVSFASGMHSRPAGVVVHEAAHLAFDKRVDGFWLSDVVDLEVGADRPS